MSKKSLPHLEAFCINGSKLLGHTVVIYPLDVKEFLTRFIKQLTVQNGSKLLGHTVYL